MLPSTIAYLGPEGSHSFESTVQLLEQLGLTTVSTNSTASLPELMQSVASKTILGGIVPVENIIEGSVTETLDTIASQRLPIRPILEWQHPIRHVLIQRTPTLVPPNIIISHTQAIGQCRQTLEERFGHRLEFVMVSSTSEAVRQLSETNDDDNVWAAIGTETAATNYGLYIVSGNVSDLPDNKTRFWLIQHQDTALPAFEVSGHWKTSLCFGTSHEAGSLADALLLLKQAGVNMSKIESRPSRQRIGEYLFHVDVLCDLGDQCYDNLVNELRSATTHFSSLPAYQCIAK